MCAQVEIPICATLRRPFQRYATLLNGPNQKPEDPASILRSHMQYERTATKPPSPHTVGGGGAEGPDVELERLSR
ncbi:MAG: hypothetical protein SGPRY_006671 [Prymnesium sp.]